MKRLQHTVVGLALAALLTCGISASAKSDGAAKRRSITAAVLGVDKRARTLRLRELGAGRTFVLNVPEGAVLQTSRPYAGGMRMESIMRGMVIQDVGIQ